jgi:nitrite reductase/ring-hydroxylating ferredoxin subunit
LILVLPAQTSGERLDEVVRIAQRLGWSAQVSRASEQLVVTLEGSGETEPLRAALAGLVVDVIPVLTGAQYRLQRSRRVLLTGLAMGLGLLTAAGTGLPLVGFLQPPSGSLTDPDLVSGGSAASLAPGRARAVLFRDEPVLLIHVEPERFVALSGLCTHMQSCRLDWAPERRLLTCTCHGCAFDLHGNVTWGPASIPLTSFRVQRIGGELFVSGS